jgi:hypothetical protein
MIEGDKEGWILIGVEADVRALLKRALESNNPEGSASARRHVERLIAKGQFGFRDLLTALIARTATRRLAISSNLSVARRTTVSSPTFATNIRRDSSFACQSGLAVS